MDEQINSYSFKLSDIVSTSEGYPIIGPSKYVGGWWFTRNFHVSAKKKPNWFHRAMVRLFFGFRWSDCDEKGNTAYPEE